MIVLLKAFGSASSAAATPPQPKRRATDSDLADAAASTEAAGPAVDAL
jgi:hypothetical protein